ncbi:MAG: serine/threonine protein kinase [Alphaproteobacteria bacterium]|nr:serine/threonine protein kinase [Alphaproteobacteria bacterium]MCB9694026.1 serine/threonine protein kinase [Alphaproteobacteria bacterium]
MDEDATTVPLVDGEPPARLEVPRVLAGRYRIDGVLGRGGMSVVYRALDLRAKVVRALKVASRAPRNPDLLERMAAEAAILALLRHPNLVEVHDMGIDRATGLHYASMDLASRGSLAEAVKSQGPLPVEQVASVGVQLLAALAVLHGRGIVHRDVKPSNLLVLADGRVVLSDLGISRIPDAAADDTGVGTVMGSFAFMAPEQRLGMDGVCEASDLYAVGATLYNLATGASAMDLFVAGPDSERWTSVPEPLKDALVQATRFDPTARPPSAQSLAQALAPLAPSSLFLRQPHLAEGRGGEVSRTAG